MLTPISPIHYNIWANLYLQFESYMHAFEMCLSLQYTSYLGSQVVTLALGTCPYQQENYSSLVA